MRFVDTNALYCGDNLELLPQLPNECVDLIYLDPPFFSNHNYEVIWGDEAEVRSFEDRWEGGIQVYINWMKERVAHLHRVLKPTGSLYLHCDWHAAHRLRGMLDDVFGENRFQNECIWYYRGGGVSPNRWGRRHDTIFFYTKGDEWTFNVDPVRTECSESVMESSPSRYDKSYRANKVYSGYRPNPLGKHPDDVWPIQPLMPSDRTERLGYPTQKPETLLERILLASSNKGDVVLGPFCGCGTTIAVAERLGREWIGMDISPTAVGLMDRRVQKVGATNVKVHGLPQTAEALRGLKHFEFQNWVIEQVNGVHQLRKTGDMGVDGWSFMYNEPIQVKRSDHVGRESIDTFETAVERTGKDVGYFVAFSFTKGAFEEAARAKAAGKATIVLVTVEQLLNATEPVTRPTMPKPARESTPDLMRLLTARQQEISEQPLPMARPKKARPSPETLIASGASK